MTPTMVITWIMFKLSLISYLDQPVALWPVVVISRALVSGRHDCLGSVGNRDDSATFSCKKDSVGYLLKTTSERTITDITMCKNILNKSTRKCKVNKKVSI